MEIFHQHFVSFTRIKCIYFSLIHICSDLIAFHVVLKVYVGKESKDSSPVGDSQITQTTLVIKMLDFVLRINLLK